MKKFINIFVYVAGMAVVSGACAFIITLASINKKPPMATPGERFEAKFKNYNYLVGEDFEFAAYIAIAVAAVWISINIALAFVGGFDSAYYEEVRKWLKYPFVRFFGVTIFSGTLGGALCFVMEFLTQTPSRPPDYSQWYEFVVVFAIFGLLVYYVIRILIWLIKKMIGTTPVHN